MSVRPRSWYEKRVDRHVELHGLPKHVFERLKLARSFMMRHHSEPIELENIAAAAFMSRHHFIR